MDVKDFDNLCTEEKRYGLFTTSVYLLTICIREHFRQQLHHLSLDSAVLDDIISHIMDNLCTTDPILVIELIPAAINAKVIGFFECVEVAVKLSLACCGVPRCDGSATGKGSSRLGSCYCFCFLVWSRRQHWLPQHQLWI